MDGASASGRYTGEICRCYPWHQRDHGRGYGGVVAASVEVVAAVVASDVVDGTATVVFISADVRTPAKRDKSAVNVRRMPFNTYCIDNKFLRRIAQRK